MRYMTAERCHELHSECVRDLELAKEIRHRAWIETLTKRLAKLNELLYGKNHVVDTCLIVPGK